MKAVIEIIKRFLFEIICGVAAIAGIVLIYLGASNMSSIKENMQAALSVRQELKSAANAGKLINKDAVEKAKSRVDKIMAADKNLRSKIRDINYYKPLIDVPFHLATPAQRSDFKLEYQKEVNSWLDKMKAGDIPTADDIAQTRDRIDEDKSQRKELGLEVKTDENAMINRPEVRAAITKAQSIYCYATENSFQESDVSERNPMAPMYVGKPPSAEQMWHAQLEVWTQRLIIDKVAEINNAAAAELEQEGSRAWVGNLPIKELVSIQTTQYYVTDATSKNTVVQSKDRAMPPGSADAVFTGNKSNELYEVMQLTTVLIVDAAKMPKIMSELSRDRFLTILNVEYESVEPNSSMQGKIYGDQPVVKLTLDMETEFFSEFYLPIMPNETLELLKKKRPEEPKTEGA
ncbi:MAG TPA: hypothetical protein PKN33_00585 [Phycisphaerae bacterium]|nr:hypothetical protein [Phycisphaerales bacterium]HNO76528.1 hypothetical protein [Phycisphaerae bacterium]